MLRSFPRKRESRAKLRRSEHVALGPAFRLRSSSYGGLSSQPAEAVWRRRVAGTSGTNVDSILRDLLQRDLSSRRNGRHAHFGKLIQRRPRGDGPPCAPERLVQFSYCPRFRVGADALERRKPGDIHRPPAQTRCRVLHRSLRQRHQTAARSTLRRETDWSYWASGGR
jgi:hypothetical protein